MDEKDYLKDIFNNINPKHEVIGANFLGKMKFKI